MRTKDVERKDVYNNICIRFTVGTSIPYKTSHLVAMWNQITRLIDAKSSNSV